MRCSEQRRRTTGILMATVRREDMCWGKGLGRCEIKGVKCHRGHSSDLKKPSVPVFSPLPPAFWNLGDKKTRRCPYFWAPLSAVGSALRSLCSGSSSLASPALVSFRISCTLLVNYAFLYIFKNIYICVGNNIASTYTKAARDKLFVSGFIFILFYFYFYFGRNAAARDRARCWQSLLFYNLLALIN